MEPVVFDGPSPDVGHLSAMRVCLPEDLKGEVRRWCSDWNKLTGVAVFRGVAAGNLPTAIERRCRCSPNHRSRIDRRELTLNITEH